MSSSKHTRGPWFVVPANPAMPTKQRIGTIGDFEILSRDDVASFEQPHNARLAAAAPELFKQLGGLLSAFEMILGALDIGDDTSIKATANGEEVATVTLADLFANTRAVLAKVEAA